MQNHTEQARRVEALRRERNISYAALAVGVGRSTMAVFNALTGRPMLVGNIKRILDDCEAHLQDADR